MAVCRSRQNAFCLSTFLLFVSVARGGESPKNGDAQVLPLIEISPDGIEVLTLKEVVKNVRISCGTPKPPDERVKAIAKLSVIRNLFDPLSDMNAGPEVMVKAENTGNRQAVPVLGTTHYKADGEVPLSQNSGQVAVTIKQASCRDSGEYTCEMVYYMNAERKESDKRIVKARQLLLTDPLPAVLSVTPDVTKEDLKLGDKVNITCVAKVGTSRPGTFKTKWQWSTRDLTAYTKLWIKRTEDDIVEGLTEGEGCEETRKSSAMLVLEEFDAAKEFRCMIVRQYSETDVKTFPDSSATIAIPDFLEKRKTLGTSAVIGIIFGILAILCGLGLGIFWYKRRKRRRKAALEEAEKMKSDMEERRKSLAIVVSKRKSLGGTHTKDYDAILTKLKETEKAEGKPKEEAEVVVEEISEVDESSMGSTDASEETSIA